MGYHLDDTIAALASAAGRGGRSVIRLSGPRALECLGACFVPDHDADQLGDIRRPTRILGAFRVDAGESSHSLLVPGAAFVWPNDRSYTRQPSAEFHGLGSSPLAAAALDVLCRAGARAALPGEFTLRAFMAGRIDLTQAEAVLQVIEARGESELDEALDQLAGGLSHPLAALRESLLATLAELEAGLDFADEHLEFISRAALSGRLVEAREQIRTVVSQLNERDRTDQVQRVLLTGRPNAGKSSLFNALAARYGVHRVPEALVSATPGTTRDLVAARVCLDGLECELLDAAGTEGTASYVDDIDGEAQRAAMRFMGTADLCVHCVDATTLQTPDSLGDADGRLVVVTKCDLANLAERHFDSELFVLRSSAVSGVGMKELAHRVHDILLEFDGDAAARTAIRCGAVLRDAEIAIAAAIDLVDGDADELVASELRSALDSLGTVVGAIAADDVLDRVFSQFCIGK